MNVEKIRSSSLNCYKFCSFQYLMQYDLNIESLSGKAALQGTIAHSVLEWIGRSRMKNRPMPDYKKFLEKAFTYHTIKNPHVTLRRETSRGEAADFKKIRESVEKVLNGPFNPYNLKVIAIEKTFKVKIPNVTTPDGEEIWLTGTIDLIHEVDENTIEIVDWKTGKRTDWGSGKLKDFYDLMRDIQPRVYHLACFLIYPQYTNIVATFHYMNDGGAFTLPFTLEDIPDTLDGLQRYATKINKDIGITRNVSWKCRTFCYYGRNDICRNVWNDRIEFGMQYVKNKYTQLNIQKQKEMFKPVTEEENV